MRTVLLFVRWGFTPTAKELISQHPLVVVTTQNKDLARTKAHAYGHPIRTVGVYSHRYR